MCVWNPLNRAWFFQDKHLRVTFLGLLSKWTFCHLSPWKPHICVLKPSHAINFRVTCLGLLEKWTFSHLISLETPVNVYWNPQNRACLPKTINLRGHMPRFTWNMNVFPSISLETHKCVMIHSEQGLIFWARSIWCVTCLGVLSKWLFSHLSSWIPHVETLNRPHFSKTIDLMGHMPI